MHPDDILRDAPEKLTPAEVAARMGKSVRTISNWLRRSSQPMPGYRLPGGWEINREELRAWIEATHN